MTGHLVDFARALRDAGVPVSPAELLDAAAAVRAAGIGEREPFRLALRACVAKQPEHQGIFDLLFDAWFHVAWPTTESRRRRRRGAPRADEGHRRGGRGEGSGRPRGDREQPGPGRAEATGAERTGHGEALRSTLVARQIARGRASREAARRRRDPRRERLDRRLTREEERLLERETERLGRALRTLHGRRYRRASSGRIDLRATVARGARTGGVPFRLLRRTHPIVRPRLLVLCDVSGSVIRVARFLLRLLHETHRLFDGTAGFVFVDRPVPAAPLFRHADFDDALDALETLPGLDLHALSDFGNVFCCLCREHLHLFTPRTSLLVLGDARCNRFDPQVWAFEALAARVAQVVWLNPEQPERWYTHDSRLRAYEPSIDHLLPAATLADLAAGIDRLVVTPYRRAK